MFMKNVVQFWGVFFVLQLLTVNVLFGSNPNRGRGYRVLQQFDRGRGGGSVDEYRSSDMGDRDVEDRSIAAKLASLERDLKMNVTNVAVNAAAHRELCRRQNALDVAIIHLREQQRAELNDVWTKLSRCENENADLKKEVQRLKNDVRDVEATMNDAWELLQEVKSFQAEPILTSKTEPTLIKQMDVMYAYVLVVDKKNDVIHTENQRMCEELEEMRRAMRQMRILVNATAIPKANATANDRYSPVNADIPRHRRQYKFAKGKAW